MNNTDPIEKTINQYLEQVRVHLDTLTEEEINEVLSNIRFHIESELQKRIDGEPTSDIVDAVLAELDPPESYAETGLAGILSDESAALADDTTSKTRFSRYPIVGAILLPFGIIMALSLFIAVPSSGGASISTGQWIARFTILPLGIIAPFACTALGLMGISEIRKSRGEVVGMPLATVVALFYPVVILDAILFFLTVRLFDSAPYWNLAIIAGVLLILVIDFFIIRAAWRTTSKPELAN